MIQFNLLPDIKQQYIRQARLKRTALVVSFLVAASALFIFIMLFLSVHVFQQTHLKNINNDISDNSQKLKDIPDLNKILTIQNQLKSLPDLHAKKPVVTRLFGYLSQITPTKTSIGSLNADFDLHTITITGTADSLETVNKFVDTLKFTSSNTLSAEGGSPTANTVKPFTDVVLNSFSRSDTDATYTISASFDPAIFDSSQKITLTVPKITSTRSETEKPTELFKALPEVKKQ